MNLIRYPQPKKRSFMKRLLSLLLICTPVICQQKSYMELLPREIQLEAVKYAIGNTLEEALRSIEKYYASTPSAKNDVGITKSIIIHLMQKFNFTTGKELQEAIDTLNKKESLPVFKNEQMKKWIGEQKKRLFYENELRDAVRDENVKKVKELIAKGVNVNLKHHSGDTLLMRAISDSYAPRRAKKEVMFEIVSALIAAGANVNATGEYGSTALSSAIIELRPDILELLLKNNADPNIPSQFKVTPLMKAINRFMSEGFPGDRPTSKKIIELLLNYKADPNAIDSKGRTLKQQITEPLWVSDEQKSELIELLRKYGLKE